MFKFNRTKRIFVLLAVVSFAFAGCGSASLEETEEGRELQGQIFSDVEDAGEISAGEEEREWVLKAPYAQAYYAFLQEYIVNADTSAQFSDIRFGFIFIDEDEIPELLIFPDNSHAAGVEVYTCIDKQVVELGIFGSFGYMQYVEKGGMIFGGFTGQGATYSDFYRIEDGKSKLVSSLVSWPDYSRLEEGEYVEFYEIDELSVTEDIFMAKWEELYDSQEYVLIGYEDGILLEETKILPVLAQAVTENLLWKRNSTQVLEQVSELSKVLESYGDFLAGNAHEGRAFTLIYLDHDDVPELVIMDGKEHLSCAEIYTYNQGETVYIGSYGQWGWITYLEKEGIIFNPYEQGGSGSCGVYKIDETEDTLLQMFGWEPDLPAGDGMNEWDSPDKRKLGYDYCTPVEGTDIPAALTERLQTLILTRYDVLRENVLIKSGLDEDAILLMDYDDYDGDGVYEAFVFCGKSYDYCGEINYSGDFWFAGADQCTRLPERFGSGSGYRKIDGLMMLGSGQKYLYYYSDYNFTANISGIWTVEKGEPVEVNLPQRGQVVYRGESNEFELWVDGYNHYYEPDGDLWTGHTWRPYFYHYDSQTGQPEPDEGEDLSKKELEEICGFDLAGEVEAQGYEVTAIVRWQPSDIVTINYTIPLDDEAPIPEITYENIIWDCKARDYWRSEERGVTSWRDAGVGGSI